MKCPECKGKIKATDYDTDYEWYECPKCEGCFTADEIIKDEIKKQKNVPMAKGKKRQTEIAEDDEAIAEWEKKVVETVVVQEKGTKHRDELQTREVVPTIAAEVQAVYEELGGRLDDANAMDKALILWRELHIASGIHAREQEVAMVKCKDHR